MSIVILSIDGKEVYTTSTSSSTSTTPHVQYTQVINPKIGNNYYRETDADEDGKPVYKESKLKNITSVPDGPNTVRPIYEFSDGHKATYTIYKLDTSLGGGEIQKKKTTKVEKKKNIFQKEILNIINI